MFITKSFFLVSCTGSDPQRSRLKFHVDVAARTVSADPIEHSGGHFFDLKRVGDAEKMLAAIYRCAKFPLLSEEAIQKLITIPSQTWNEELLEKSSRKVKFQHRRTREVYQRADYDHIPRGAGTKNPGPPRTTFTSLSPSTKASVSSSGGLITAKSAAGGHKSRCVIDSYEEDEDEEEENSIGDGNSQEIDDFEGEVKPLRRSSRDIPRLSYKVPITKLVYPYHHLIRTTNLLIIPNLTNDD